jgi:tetratricopeptide (TPR) repeat protein
MSVWRRFAGWMPVLAVAAALGCASVKLPAFPEVKDVAPQRKARGAAALREFEQGRDFAEYEAALARWREQDLPGCRERLETLLARNPRHADARLLMAELNEVIPVGCYEPVTTVGPPRSCDAGRNGNRACAETRDPVGGAEAGSPQGLLEEGALALSRGLPEAALACFREAAAIKPPNPQIPISAAVISLQYHRPELAIELLEPSVKDFPDSAPLYRVLGTAYYRRGDYASSGRALQEALRLDNASGLSYFLMGCALAKLGQVEAAESHFRQAQSIDPRYAVGRAGQVGPSASSAR